MRRVNLAYVLVMLAVWIGLPCAAQGQGRITARSGASITLSVGSRDGVRVGMTGEVILVTSVGDRMQRVSIANFRVERVEGASSRAVLTVIGDGFEDTVGAGLEVAFSQPLVRPTPAPEPRPTEPPRPAPTLPPDPVELLRQGNSAWERGDWGRAADAYERLLALVPGHPIAAERAPVARGKVEEARRAEAEARRQAEERARQEREARERAEQERRNLPLYRETAKTFVDAGQWEKAAEWLKRIAAVEPGDAYLRLVLDGRVQQADQALAAAQFDRAESLAGEVLAVAEHAGARSVRQRSGEAREAARRAQLGAWLAEGDEAAARGDLAAAVVAWGRVLAAAAEWPGLAERLASLRRRFPPSGAAYAYVPAGAFTMGCVPGDSQCGGDEKPAHRVTLSRGFWMKTTEVTVGEYRVFASATRRRMPSSPGFSQSDDHPVVNVDWNDGEAYCRWAGGRLPSEAEWEYAARGGREGLIYPWGNEPPVCRKGASNGARFDDDAGCDAENARTGGTDGVGSYAPNGYGLYDMAGNVWEWCADWYDAGYYASSPSTDPKGPSSGGSRVLRGGSWFYYPRSLRVSYRFRVDPSYRNLNLGFRCLRDE